MTLAIQKKAKNLNNEDIFNSIIKKENGVNPFLTVMNFKISFKTWLKFARKNLRQKERDRLEREGELELVDHSTSLFEEEKQKTVLVEIEVEELYSCTSEEDNN